MGLDFSHCGAGWSYGSFNRFRDRLFSETSNGLSLQDMEGFSINLFGADTGKSISFNEYNHPLRDFIDHSDCGGELIPEQLAIIEPALRDHVEQWESCYDKSQALELCQGMRKAITNNEDLRFQ